MLFYNMIENKNFNDLNPLTCGTCQCPPDIRYGPHIRTFYLIHFIIKGKGKFISGGREYDLGENQAFLIRPNEITVYISDRKDPWEYIWIGFDGAYAKKLDELQSVIMDVSPDFIRSIMAVRDLNAMKEEYLAGHLFLLFSRLLDKKIKNNYAEIVKNYIVTHYNMKISVEQISKVVNLDKRYINRVFKNYFGSTIKQYLIYQRMKEATRLLKLGFLVKTTALMVGYEDVFVFSRAFKNHYGISPATVYQQYNNRK